MVDNVDIIDNVCYNRDKSSEGTLVKRKVNMAIYKVNSVPENTNLIKVKYSSNYLKRIFNEWTDEELVNTRRMCLQKASLIKAEMERRNEK